MCVYNGERYISQSIRSVLNQTFTDFEFIIINDGSTDATEKIIKSFDDPRIRYYVQKNIGAASARNFGIKASVGKYVAILDSDDICMENRFEEQYKFLENNPGYVLAGSNAIFIDRYGKEICNIELVNDWDTIDKMKYVNPFIHSSVFFDREAGIKAGLYPEGVRIGEDLLFFLQLKKYGKMVNLPLQLIKYRINPEGASLRDGRLKAIFGKIIDEYCENRSISGNHIEAINKGIATISPRAKLHYYHLNIIRLLLFNSRKPFEVFKHFIQAIYYVPFSKKLIQLLAVSFIPKRYRKKTYSGIKNKISFLF